MHPDRPRYVIDRPAYNLPDFDREFVRKSRRFPVGERVRRFFRYRITNLDRPGATMKPTPSQYTSFVSGSIQRLDVLRAFCRKPLQRVSLVCFGQMLCVQNEGLVVPTPACTELASKVLRERKPAVWRHQWGQRWHHSGSPRSVNMLLLLLPLTAFFCILFF